MKKQDVQNKLDTCNDLRDFFEDVQIASLPRGYLDPCGYLTNNSAAATYNRKGCTNRVIQCEDGFVIY